MANNNIVVLAAMARLETADRVTTKDLSKLNSEIKQLKKTDPAKVMDFTKQINIMNKFSAIMLKLKAQNSGVFDKKSRSLNKAYSEVTEMLANQIDKKISKLDHQIKSNLSEITKNSNKLKTILSKFTNTEKEIVKIEHSKEKLSLKIDSAKANIRNLASEVKMDERQQSEILSNIENNRTLPLTKLERTLGLSSGTLYLDHYKSIAFTSNLFGSISNIVGGHKSYSTPIKSEGNTEKGTQWVNSLDSYASALKDYNSVFVRLGNKEDNLTDLKEEYSEIKNLNNALAKNNNIILETVGDLKKNKVLPH